MTVVVDYNPLDPQTLENPYPVYRDLRERYPVFWHEKMNSWVLTRYADCREVLRNNDLFCRDRRRVGVDVPEYLQNLQTLDPPEQNPLKTVLSNALRAQDLNGIGLRARGEIEELFRDLGTRDGFDWIHDVAAPVALSITSTLFGVEQPPLDFYVPLSDAIARRMDIGLIPEREAPGNDAKQKLNGLVSKWYAADEVNDGVLSTLRRTASEAGVAEHYVRNTTGVMFNASYGTLFATVSNIALTLIRYPEVLKQLRETDDTHLLDTTVDELIRFEGPAQGTSRVATERTEIAGTVIERGQVVLTLIGSANRDPDEFERPEELVIDRSPNRHLAFGWGVHGCLGAVFGRIAVKSLVECLLEVPALELTGAPKRRTTATVRSMDYLPVAFAR